MLECLIVGDSIAVGTKMFKPECAVIAHGGWNTWQWNKQHGREDLQAHTVIISLGTNDHAGVRTEPELRAVRANAHADRVFWILPAIKPNIQDIVRRVAADYGDTVLPITSLQPDKIHPSWAGYKQIAKETRD
jgi:lysophospholipase L1-like esterase